VKTEDGIYRDGEDGIWGKKKKKNKEFNQSLECNYS
jgi:hypothetical protein